ncbi:MAG: aldehyde dehydrogenase family protein [Rhizobiales bacterium]|nr:aldehyde dehydrogenase family protein [Hyphomicrobiales bacterium]
MISFDKDFTLTINGAGVAGPSQMDVLNPASERVVAQAPAASRAQLDAAVAAARRAFPGWRARPMAERQAAVRQMGERILENLGPLTRLLTSEHGKPHADAERELRGAAYWCAEHAGFELPVVETIDTPERRSVTRRVPIGVVGAIAPWNFPVTLSMWKVVAAILTGNTLVLKPSPFTPLTTLKLGELFRDLVPPGVLNVISGADELGPWMTEHPGIDKISFTGSTQTGRRIMASAGPTLKRLTLELGGNDPAIVLPDVDVPAAARDLFWAAFANTSQICIAVKRMYVHEDIYDAFSAALVDYAATVKVGDGAEQGTQIGPIQNRPQYERVCKLIDEARDSGLTFLAGGEVDRARPGYFIPVTIVDNPPDDAPVVAEEAFGPVLPLLKFSDVDDVVRRANDTEYGLGGSVWSRDLDRAADIAAQLDCGTVWINETRFLSPHSAFGGHKQSGIGVENGMEGLLEYTNTQTVVVKAPAQ